MQTPPSFWPNSPSCLELCRFSSNPLPPLPPLPALSLPLFCLSLSDYLPLPKRPHLLLPFTIPFVIHDQFDPLFRGWVESNAKPYRVDDFDGLLNLAQNQDTKSLSLSPDLSQLLPQNNIVSQQSLEILRPRDAEIPYLLKARGPCRWPVARLSRKSRAAVREHSFGVFE